MSATARKTAPLPDDIRAMKGHAPIVSLTAYTTPMARMMDAEALKLNPNGTRQTRRSGEN